MRLWDVAADGLLSEPLATRTFPDYPLYACAVNPAVRGAGRGASLACAGGSGETSFVGTPVHILRDS